MLERFGGITAILEDRDLLQLPTLQLNITTVAHDHPPGRFEIVAVIVPPKRNFVAASDRS
jgi:hypothetical protein